MNSKKTIQKERLKTAIESGSSSVGKLIQKKPNKRQIESKTQQECVKWFRYEFPYYRTLLFAIPNGIKAGGKTINYKGKQIPLAAINAKKEGVVSGVADMFLAIPKLTPYDSERRNGLFIEMKIVGDKPDPNQVLFREDVEKMGYQYSVCHTVDEFIKTITEYL